MKLLIPLFIVCLVGCTTAKKASKFMREHPEVNAPICADQFPVRDSLIKGDTITTTDTLEIFDTRTDTLRHLDTITITRYKTNTVTNTRTIRDTIIRENTARVVALQNVTTQQAQTIADRDTKITELTEAYEDMRRKRNRLRWIIYVLAGGAAVFLYFKARKLF